MSSPAEIPVAFRTLYASPLVGIRDYACHACRGGPGPEEGSTDDSIVLMRHGAFCRHFGRRAVTADVNQVAFFPKGSSYRVSHPVDCGDRGTTFALPPRVLGEILRELDPRLAEGPEGTLPFLGGPCTSELFWRHRALVRRLTGEDSRPLEPFWVEVNALQLAADALVGAFAHAGRPLPPRRKGTRKDHAELAERVKAHLSGRLGERLTLGELAQAVHASPFHLARLFQQHTGTTLHRYLTLLRLRAALARLEGGEPDLTSLALDLGFSSHSHLTGAFRQEFGVPPSKLRGKPSKRLRELRKNLEA